MRKYKSESSIQEDYGKQTNFLGHIHKRNYRRKIYLLGKCTDTAIWQYTIILYIKRLFVSVGHQFSKQLLNG